MITRSGTHAELSNTYATKEFGEDAWESGRVPGRVRIPERGTEHLRVIIGIPSTIPPCTWIKSSPNYCETTKFRRMQHSRRQRSCVHKQTRIYCTSTRKSNVWCRSGNRFRGHLISTIPYYHLLADFYQIFYKKYSTIALVKPIQFWAQRRLRCSWLAYAVYGDLLRCRLPGSGPDYIFHFQGIRECSQTMG